MRVPAVSCTRLESRSLRNLQKNPLVFQLLAYARTRSGLSPEWVKEEFGKLGVSKLLELEEQGSF